MKSYASVDSIEGKIIICEVEQMTHEESRNIPFGERKTEMIDIPLEIVSKNETKLEEGDIILLEHEDGKVLSIYGKDEEEKQRRIEELNSIMANM